MAPVTLWLLIAAGVLVGALLGGAIALVVLRRAGGAGSDVNALKGELDDYRREVAEHYVETAKRVDALTHAYKSVYDHLEDGAYRLVGEHELRARLEDASSEPVTIEGIGQRVLQRPDEDRDAARRDDAAGGVAAGGDAMGGDAMGDDATGDDTDGRGATGRGPASPDEPASPDDEADRRG